MQVRVVLVMRDWTLSAEGQCFANRWGGVLCSALGEPAVVGGEFSALTQLCRVLSVLPCSNRGLFAGDCNINNATGLFIIFKFGYKIILEKCLFARNISQGYMVSQEKIITMESFDCGLSMIFRKIYQ